MLLNALGDVTLEAIIVPLASNVSKSVLPSSVAFVRTRTTSSPTLKSTSLLNVKFVNSSPATFRFSPTKKLKSELSKFGYQLKNEQGYWQLYLNE